MPFPPDSVLAMAVGTAVMQASPKTGIDVAVVDSGVCKEHESLASCTILPGLALPDHRSGMTDRNGHGTAIAAIIHAHAPAARLLPIRVLDDNLRCRGDVLAEAIECAADHGAHVINVSADTCDERHRPRLEAAVRRALEADAIVVASTGRFGAASLPAMLPGVVSVGAGVLASPLDLVRGSVGGPLILGFGQGQVVPALPDGYELRAGSSYAAARVSGTAAALAERVRLRGSSLASALLDLCLEAEQARRSGILLQNDLAALQSLSADVSVDPSLESAVIEEVSRRIQGPVLPQSRLFAGGGSHTEEPLEAIRAAGERIGARPPLMLLGLQHVISPHAIAATLAASLPCGQAAEAIARKGGDTHGHQSQEG